MLLDYGGALGFLMSSSFDYYYRAIQQAKAYYDLAGSEQYFEIYFFKNLNLSMIRNSLF